jgi:hypothetical protein
MTGQTERLPYAHTLSEINDVNASLNVIAGTGIPGDLAVGVLTARSNLAIASALLAVADAIRSTKQPHEAPCDCGSLQHDPDVQEGWIHSRSCAAIRITQPDGSAR